MKTATRKKGKKKLTLNQKRVLDRIGAQIQKDAKVSVTKAMRGIYSPSYAARPEKITTLPEYEQLLNTHLSDEKIARRHEELLDKRDTTIVYERKKVGRKWTETHKVLDHGPETAAVGKALDMAYKIKGRYPKEGANVALMFNFGGGSGGAYRQ